MEGHEMIFSYVVDIESDNGDQPTRHQIANAIHGNGETRGGFRLAEISIEGSHPDEDPPFGGPHGTRQTG